MKKNFFLSTVIFLLVNTTSIVPYNAIQNITYFNKNNFMSTGGTNLDQTVTINTPGTYVLTENIVSTVTSNQVISITANNVVFDLNGFTITGQSGSNMNGIEIATNGNNIEIKNGTIYSVGNSGIFVNQSVHNLKISNITCNSCNTNNGSAAAGIYLSGSSGNEISHCAIDNCITFSVVPQTENAYGIYAKNTQNLTLNNCRTEHVRNIGANHSSTGYYITESTYPIITESKAYLSEGDSLGAGFYLLTCTGATLKKCNSEGSSASDIANALTPGRGYGFYFNDANNCLISDCHGINNNGNNAGTGFYIISCINNRYINCTGQGNHGTGSSGTAICAGFETTKDNTTPKRATQACLFKNCSGIGQYCAAGSSGSAAGFTFGGTTRFCMIEGSFALGNNGRESPGYGIFLNGNSLLLNIIKDNNAFANTANSGVNSYGIYDNATSSTRALFFGNVCANNASAVGIAPTDSDIVSAYIDIPKFGTDLDTFESSQVNTTGWNFIAKADNV